MDIEQGNIKQNQICTFNFRRNIVIGGILLVVCLMIGFIIYAFVINNNNI